MPVRGADHEVNVAYLRGASVLLEDFGGEHDIKTGSMVA